MEGFPADRYYMHIITKSMTHLQLIVLSYHEFYDTPNNYTFSRSYSQFREDMETKTFDLITIDDAHWSCKKAFEMMREKNHRGILFVPTSLIGSSQKYLTWSDIHYIAQFHEIGNHSHHHVNLRELNPLQVTEEILSANNLIEKHTGKKPRFFVPPFNKSNKHVENVAAKF